MKYRMAISFRKLYLLELNAIVLCIIRVNTSKEYVIDSLNFIGQKLCEDVCKMTKSCNYITYSKEKLVCDLMGSSKDFAHETRSVSIMFQNKTECQRLCPPYHACIELSVEGVECIRTECDGSLRLSNRTGGLLQVCHHNVWGTVCDDYFGYDEANVTCRTLGYSYGYIYTHGGGDGPIWLDDVECYGSESHLLNCTHNGWGLHNCGHLEDVGLDCL